MTGRHERVGPEQRLPQRDAERELIAAGAAAFAVVLLGRHVCRRADQRAGLGDVAIERAARRPRRRGVGGGRDPRHQPLGGGQLVGGAGQPEVGHRDVAGGVDQHVARLEVAVDQAGGVGGGQPAAGGDEQRDDVGGRQGVAGQVLAEGGALDELHGQEHPAVDLAGVVDRDHVGVGQLGQRLGLADQPRRRVGGAIGRRQHLDRHPAIELRIVRGVHLAHPAGAHLALDLVATEPLPCGQPRRRRPARGGQARRRRRPQQGRVGGGDLRRLESGRSVVVAGAAPHPPEDTAATTWRSSCRPRSCGAWPPRPWGRRRSARHRADRRWCGRCRRCRAA